RSLPSPPFTNRLKTSFGGVSSTSSTGVPVSLSLSMVTTRLPLDSDAVSICSRSEDDCRLSGSRRSNTMSNSLHIHKLHLTAIVFDRLDDILDLPDQPVDLRGIAVGG